MVFEGMMWAERDRIKQLVAVSPTTATMVRKSTKLVDNGFGKMVPDLFDTGSSVTVTFRLAHDKKAPAVSQGNEQGVFTTNNNRIATWAWDVDIQEGDTFTDADLGKTFAFRDVDVLRKYGGVIGYQAAIIEAGDVAVIAPFVPVIPTLSTAQRASLDIILGRLRKPLQNLPDVEKRQVNDVVDSIDRRMTAGEPLVDSFKTEIQAYLDSVMVYAQALTQIQKDKANIQVEKIRAMVR